MVVEIGADPRTKEQGRYFYLGGVLRERLTDETGDGRSDLRQVFDDQGRLMRSEEEPDESGRFTLVWFYDDTATAIRAEKDTTGDGRTNIWYEYRNNRLTALAEDTSGDGKPDLWELYDEAEALVKRSKDLNSDGLPDMVETF
jgi:hypothetical protein